MAYNAVHFYTAFNFTIKAYCCECVRWILNDVILYIVCSLGLCLISVIAYKNIICIDNFHCGLFMLKAAGVNFYYLRTHPLKCTDAWSKKYGRLPPCVRTFCVMRPG